MIISSIRMHIDLDKKILDSTELKSFLYGEASKWESVDAATIEQLNLKVLNHIGLLEIEVVGDDNEPIPYTEKRGHLLVKPFSGAVH